MGIWRRKLKGRAGNVALAVMFGLQVLHGEAADPMLSHLPKPAEPYAANWEDSEVTYSPEPVDPNRNSSPAATGARFVSGSATLALRGHGRVTGRTLDGA